MRRLAAGVCALEALVLVVLGVLSGWDLARGASTEASGALMLTVLIAVMAVALALLGRAWWRGAGWPNTPTVVWNLLLVPVAWSLLQAGRVAIGVAVAVLAAVGVVAAVRARAVDADSRP